MTFHFHHASLELDRDDIRVQPFDARFPKTLKALNAGIDLGAASGIVAGLWDGRTPDQFLISSIGSRRVVPSSLGLFDTTVFDVSSLTKVMVTAAMAGLLVEKGMISWDTPISAVFADYPYKDICVKHLLAHTAGFVAHRNFFEQIRTEFEPQSLVDVPVKKRQAAMRRLIFAEKPVSPPGEKTVYSDIGPMILGFMFEEILNEPLDEAAKHQIFEPMQLANTYYSRVEGKKVDEQVAATENSPWRGGVLQGQVHDDNCWAMGGYSAHAGCFSNAFDVLRFAERMTSGFLTPKTLEKMWSRVPPLGERALGWDAVSATGSLAGRYFSANSVGHWGFTGTSLWIDLDAGLAVTLLTNRVHPSRDNNAIRNFRPLFHDAIREDIFALQSQS